MRNLKFRGWDTLRKKMVPWETIFSDRELLQSFFGDESFMTSPPKRLMIKMQYTGLKDKNGKEIYEGDVLNVKCKDGGIVEWPNHLVQWEHVQGYIGFWIPEQTHNRPGKHEYSIEIMGNIHQDPDLITKFVK